MFDLFHDIPGRLFVAATLLPLLAAIGLLLAGTVRRLNNPITTLPLFASPSLFSTFSGFFSSLRSCFLESLISSKEIIEEILKIKSKIYLEKLSLV